MAEPEGGAFASESDDDQDEYNFANEFAYNVGAYVIVSSASTYLALPENNLPPPP